MIMGVFGGSLVTGEGTEANVGNHFIFLRNAL
jgi:hypothetical protein